MTCDNDHDSLYEIVQFLCKVKAVIVIVNGHGQKSLESTIKNDFKLGCKDKK